MITFTLVHKAKSEQEFEEFCKSLSYSNSGINNYEVISDKELPNNINRVDSPSLDSLINVTIADDCLVLGNSWDKYIMHAIDNGLPQYGLGRDYTPTWEGYLQRRMGLHTRRPPEGIFPDLKVAVASKK